MPVVNYIVANGRLIAEKRAGSRKFYLPDALGSTRALVNDSQTKTDTFTYWPYGEIEDRTGNTVTPFRWLGAVPIYSDHLYFLNPAYLPHLVAFLGGQTAPGGRLTQPEQAAKDAINRMLQKCAWSLSERHRNTLLIAWWCLVYGESSFDSQLLGPYDPNDVDPRTGKNRKNERLRARGATQINQWSLEDCAPPECKDKIFDLNCNIEAAFNLFVSMCNDPLVPTGQKDPVPRNPLSAFRGYWECTRPGSSGARFRKCLEDRGESYERIKDVPCPPKTRACPGCRTARPVKDRSNL